MQRDSSGSKLDENEVIHQYQIQTEARALNPGFKYRKRVNHIGASTFLTFNSAPGHKISFAEGERGRGRGKEEENLLINPPTIVILHCLM